MSNSHSTLCHHLISLMCSRPLYMFYDPLHLFFCCFQMKCTFWQNLATYGYRTFPHLPDVQSIFYQLRVLLPPIPLFVSSILYPTCWKLWICKLSRGYFLRMLSARLDSCNIMMFCPCKWKGSRSTADYLWCISNVNILRQASISNFFWSDRFL